MGKKNRRRNRNKKTVNDAASASATATATPTATATATASATATVTVTTTATATATATAKTLYDNSTDSCPGVFTSSDGSEIRRSNAASATAANGAGSGTNQCLHGSTEDKFHPNSEYMKAAQGYLDNRNQSILLDNEDGSENQQATAFRRIYDEAHMHLIKDPEFHLFIFAYCTQQYLECNNFKDESRQEVIQTLLFLGIKCRYISTDLEKFHKYNRDILTKRSMIKVLVRETKTHCKCMNEGKVIAKTMDIIGICIGCDKVFPKENLSFCSGCHIMKYHSRECQNNHWHIHKLSCKRSSKSIAKVRNDSNNRNIRVAMAATLGWCLNAADVHLAFQSSLSNDPLEAATQLPAVEWVRFVLGWGAFEWMAENE